ncbi:MAG: flagellar basal body rod C-terminal domain-containing protein, partial [Pseudomonadota bacterium]
LFTDNGAAFDPAAVTGLAGRLSLNQQVDPFSGGDPTRLRDGLNAVTQGEPGNTTILRGLQDAMTVAQAAPAGTGLSGSFGAAELAAEIGNITIARSRSAEAATGLLQGRFDGLQDAERSATGVDTDQELSRLLVVEQMFAANARVIEVIDTLLTRLTQI